MVRLPQPQPAALSAFYHPPRQNLPKLNAFDQLSQEVIQAHGEERDVVVRRSVLGSTFTHSLLGRFLALIDPVAFVIAD